MLHGTGRFGRPDGDGDRGGDDEGDELSSAAEGGSGCAGDCASGASKAHASAAGAASANAEGTAAESRMVLFARAAAPAPSVAAPEASPGPAGRAQGTSKIFTPLFCA